MRWCLRFGVRVLSDYNFELELPFSKIGLRLQRGATALLRFILLHQPTACGAVVRWRG